MLFRSCEGSLCLPRKTPDPRSTVALKAFRQVRLGPGQCLTLAGCRFQPRL